MMCVCVCVCVWGSRRPTTAKMDYTKLTIFKEEKKGEMVQHLDASPRFTRMHKQVQSERDCLKLIISNVHMRK